MDFGSHLGSIFAPFSSFVHHFFEYRFCIDFSSILGWFFHRIFIIFRCKTRSATEPREPCFLTTVWCSALIFMFSTSSFFMFFRSFSVSILASVFTYFWTSFAFIFGAQNGEQSGILDIRFLAVFWTSFLMDVGPKRSQNGAQIM